MGPEVMAGKLDDVLKELEGKFRLIRHAGDEERVGRSSGSRIADATVPAERPRIRPR